LTGRRVYLTPGEVGTVLESIEHSIRNIRDWHMKNGKPEWAENTIAPLQRLKDKLRNPDARGS
jgi:hypothetical protein